METSKFQVADDPVTATPRAKGFASSGNHIGKPLVLERPVSVCLEGFDGIFVPKMFQVFSFALTTIILYNRPQYYRDSQLTWGFRNDEI